MEGLEIINLVLSDKAYEHDVYPLFKAFYPEDIIKVYTYQEYEDQISLAAALTSRDQKQAKDETFKADTQKVLPRVVYIDFEADKILLKNIEQKQEIREFAISRELPKNTYKYAMQRFIYYNLSELTGRTLPWGILTGIRPTKLAYEMLEKGLPESEICQWMREEFLCSDEKIKMSIRIAKRELELLRQMDYQKGYSIYIGIPFCPTTCLYCSFTSFSITRYADLVESYLSALFREIEYAATCFPDKKLTTVYLGGGTPTTLSAHQLDRLLEHIRMQFDFTHVMEFCVEAGRPDSITMDKLQVLKKWGVDRISINPQSMQQKTLDIIGRRHTVEEIKSAFWMAREAGHNNINMDIIIGLPEETPEDVVDTLRQIKELNPDSLTVHTLAIKRAARLNIEKESYVDKKASDVPGMLKEALKFAEENDYLPYYLYRQKNMTDNLENIGFSRYGMEGLYNILIMEEQQTILALGAGGSSKFVFHKEHRLERVENVKSVTDYINRIDEMISRKRKFIEANKHLL